MAPSSGYHLVPKAVHMVRYAISRSSDLLRARLGCSTPSLEVIPVQARNVQQAIHPFALLKRSRTHFVARRARLFSTAVARIGRLGAGATESARSTTRSTFPASATRAALSRTTHAPFSSPLRPNLTGGTLPRSAGGYGLGSGGFGAARHFSHTGSAQAHVVQNVHAAVRAFMLQGHKPLYTGSDSKTGAARFRSVGPAESMACKALQARPRQDARGTSLDFHIAPAITSLPLTTTNEPTMLDDDALLTGLATDFSRQLRDLAAVHTDLKRLSRLGGLPIIKPDSSTLRVRFPGCDATSVIALCDELGVTRGVVREDPGWRNNDFDSDHVPDRDVEMALLFPLAPTGQSCHFGECHFDRHRAKTPYSDHERKLEWLSMLSPFSSSQSSASHNPALLEYDDILETDSAFESLAVSDAATEDAIPIAGPNPTTGYEGVEGIYRFLRELDNAGRKM